MLVLTRKTDESITAKIPQVPEDLLDALLAQWQQQHGPLSTPDCCGQAVAAFVEFAKQRCGELPTRTVRIVVTKIKGSGPGATAKIGTVADKDVRVVRTEIADQPQRAPQEEAAP